jgi:hypothetical protein
MVREQQAEISIDDLHPRNDGFVQSYKGQWREQGMLATAWLDPADPHRFQLGVFLRDAYELTSIYERAKGGQPRTTRQAERGAKLAHKLRERMKAEMKAAGWQVVAQTKEGQDIWQHKPMSDFKVQRVTPTHISVTRTARNVSFWCQVCGQETTQLRMPGPRPRYCSDTCKEMGERAKTRDRVARLRERQKQAVRESEE